MLKCIERIDVILKNNYNCLILDSINFIKYLGIKND